MTERNPTTDRYRVWSTLARCPSLSSPSPERDGLWLAVRDCICTRTQVAVTPLGSASAVLVTSEYASDELLAAMTWLYSHEDQARIFPPLDLYIALRGVATRGASGSARSAQADSLHGMTGVEPGKPVRWTELQDPGAA